MYPASPIFAEYFKSWFMMRWDCFIIPFAILIRPLCSPQDYMQEIAVEMIPAFVRHKKDTRVSVTGLSKALYRASGFSDRKRKRQLSIVKTTKEEKKVQWQTRA
jgi:hypothetical protein